MRVFLALPAYNEEAALPGLFEALARELYGAGQEGKIVIVDDGSTDRTPRLIEDWSSRLPLERLRHSENRGLGETVRDALQRAVELASPDDVVVTMDADNSHSPALIPEMVRLLEQGYELVIASRYQPGAAVLGLSRFRHRMSDGARLLFRLAAPIPGVRDYTSGFRAYRASLLQRAWSHYDGRLVTERGFACMAEILLKLRLVGVKACETPMVLRYDRKPGPSKMRVGHTVAKTLRLLLHTRRR